MSQVAAWLQVNEQDLLEITQKQLLERDVPQYKAEIWSREFADGLISAIYRQVAEPLYRALDEWLEILETHPTLNSTMGILLGIQSALFAQVRRNLTAQEALELIGELEGHFTAAAMHIVEAEIEVRTKLAQRALERTKRDMERLDKHKSDFISVAAHELKTPLTLIEGYTNMLKPQITKPDFPGASLILKGIEGGTRRLREIIEDMIDVSMLDMQLMSLHMQPIWVKRMLDIAVDELGKIAAERNITITFDRETLPDDAIYGDPERIHQVFEKLIENGIKYTPDDGKIHVFGRKIDNMIEIVVEDSGIGLNQDDLNLIFEKFFSLGQAALHSSSKTKFKGGGPGLGLAIAKGIIEAHGGRIWAESAGHDEVNYPGSAFHVLLHLPDIPLQEEIEELEKSAADVVRTEQEASQVLTHTAVVRASDNNH